MFFVFAVCLSFCVVGQNESNNVDSSYVAAVYEHRVILNPEPHVPISRSAALQHMHKNLDVYQEQAALAAQQVWTTREQRNSADHLRNTRVHVCEVW